MSTRSTEIAIGGIAVATIIGGTIYVLEQRKAKGSTTPPALTVHRVKVLGPLNVAPQTLPNTVTQRRCGTGYLSFGPAPANANYIMVAKYTNQKLVAQYYQPKTNTAFDSGQWPNNWVGGYDCSQPSQQSNPANTAARYNWQKVSDTKYIAQSGATLSGLGVVTGISYQKLAGYNCLSYPYYVYAGNAYYTVQQNCGNGSPGVGPTYTHHPTSSAGSSSSPPPGGQAPTSGYFYAGIFCGIHMYARAIPKQLPVNLAIPQIFDTIFNTVWYNLGHPLNTQNQPLTGYTQVASYNQDGTWTGNWAILSLGNVASGLAIGNKSASFNWLGHVCTKT